MAVATSDASAAPAGTDVPEAGQLVRVRGQQWVVSQVRASRQPADPLAEAVLPGRTLVELSSVADDDLGAGLSVVWEVEPGRQVLPVSELPAVEPERLTECGLLVRGGTTAEQIRRHLVELVHVGVLVVVSTPAGRHAADHQDEE